MTSLQLLHLKFPKNHIREESGYTGTHISPNYGSKVYLFPNSFYLLMEDFLEANRIVEISLSKLSTKNGDVPLRKTLFITQVLNRAQDVATSAQDCLSHTSRRSSKLLANFCHAQSDSIDDLPAGNHRVMKPPSRQQSPIALESRETLKPPPAEEPMDFSSVSSILGDILRDTSSSSSEELLDHNGADWECTETISPGKRNYQKAFALIPEDSQSFDLKRFKYCTLEASTLDSVPGLCGYLSSKNLQTAPFITYMFGKGFTHPSTPNSGACDWPTTTTDHVISELIPPPPLQSSSVSPILAF